MYTTLIDPATLAAHLDDPPWVVLDARFDLTAPAKGEALYREAHIPGARYVSLDAHLSGAKTGTNGRHPLPRPRRRPPAFGAPRRRRATPRSVLYDADMGMFAARGVVDAALARPRARGGARRRARGLAAGRIARDRTPRSTGRRRRSTPRRRPTTGACRPATSQAHLGDARPRARRRAGRRPFPRRERDARSGGRPHSRRGEPLLPAEPHAREDVQAARGPARRVGGHRRRRRRLATW